MVTSSIEVNAVRWEIRQGGLLEYNAVSTLGCLPVCIYATPSSNMNVRESIVNELKGFRKVILKFEPMYNVYLK